MKQVGFIGAFREPSGDVQLSTYALMGAEQITGHHDAAVSKQRISDIEYDRYGMPQRPLLRQLARVLKLDIDLLEQSHQGRESRAGRAYALRTDGTPPLHSDGQAA